MSSYVGSDKIKRIKVGSENTNCITSVPNNIIYTITNGRIVLKTGSYIYVPNGAGIFTKVAITTDLTSDTGAYSGLYAVGVNASTLTPQGISILTNTVSSESEPESPPSLQGWYDTANNIIKRYNNGWQAPLYSIPIVEAISDGTNITAANRVFDWCSYIGGRGFVFPSVTCYEPNQLKSDGTYNVSKQTSSRVFVTGEMTGNIANRFMCANNTTFGDWMTGYYEVDKRSDVTTNGWYYIKNENVVCNYNNSTWGNPELRCPLVSVVVTNGKITSFTPLSVQPSTTTIQAAYVYNGSDLVYQLNPYAIGTVISNTQTAGSLTLYPGTYELKISGAGGTGGHASANWGNHNGSGGSGACWEGTIRVSDEPTISWTTGTGAAASVTVSINGTAMVTAGGGGNADVSYSVSQGGAAGVVSVQSAFSAYVVSTSNSSNGTKGANTAVSWGDTATGTTAAPSTMGWGIGESSTAGGRTDGGFYLKRIA